MKSPTEFKILSVRECAGPDPIDTPERAATYWKNNLPQADWYDPAKEAFVVLVLNTRRRLLGHNLVGLGTLDSCQVHRRPDVRNLTMGFLWAAYPLKNTKCFLYSSLQYQEPWRLWRKSHSHQEYE